MNDQEKLKTDKKKNVETLGLDPDILIYGGGDTKESYSLKDF